MDYGPFRRYVALRAQRQELKDQLKDLENQIGALGTWMLDTLNEEGVPHVKFTVGGQTHTIASSKRLWAKSIEGKEEELAEYLRGIGMASICRANTHSLSAYVREEVDSKRPLNRWLLDLISLSTSPNISLTTKTREETAADRADATLAQQKES